jgi:hypothetical protein
LRTDLLYGCRFERFMESALGRDITSQDKLRIAGRVISRREEMLRRFEKEIVDLDRRYKPLPASTLCFPYMTGLGKKISRLTTKLAHLQNGCMGNYLGDLPVKSSLRVANPVEMPRLVEPVHDFWLDANSNQFIPAEYP